MTADMATVQLLKIHLTLKATYSLRIDTYHSDDTHDNSARRMNGQGFLEMNFG